MRHGTRTAYSWHNCRCEECTEANRVYKSDRYMGETGPRAPRWDESVSVLCWCMAREVIVPLSEIRAKRTGSCGATGCHPPTVRARNDQASPSGKPGSPIPRHPAWQ